MGLFLWSYDHLYTWTTVEEEGLKLMGIYIYIILVLFQNFCLIYIFILFVCLLICLFIYLFYLFIYFTIWDLNYFDHQHFVVMLTALQPQELGGRKRVIDMQLCNTLCGAVIAIHNIYIYESKLQPIIHLLTIWTPILFVGFCNNYIHSYNLFFSSINFSNSLYY